MALLTKETISIGERGISLTFYSGHTLIHVKSLSLTKNIAALKETLVTITEWNPLSLIIKKQKNTSFSINLPEYELIPLEDEETEKEITLYQFGPSNTYPWTNGKYIYTVNINDETHYGLLKVRAKNITEDEFTNMHNYLESKLNGISHEYTKLSETFYTQVNDESAYFQLELWILNNIDNLIETLYSIERNFISHFRKVYVMETVPKRLDRKSLQWAIGVKGSVFKGQKHYNRKYRLTANASENRFVKMASLTIMKHMKKIIVEKESQLQYIEKEITDFKQKIKSIKETIEQVLETNRYTRIDIYRRKNSKQNTKRDLEMSQQRKSDLVKTLRVLETNYQKVSYILHNTFWKYVSHTQSRNIKLTNKKYSTFQKIWNKFLKIEGSLLEERNQMQNESKNQILHSTPVLYEYYTFFKVSDILRELDFNVAEKSERLKLSSGFYELLPGSSIQFTKENLRIDIIYEEEVDYDANIAIQNKTYFFSR